MPMYASGTRWHLWRRSAPAGRLVVLSKVPLDEVVERQFTGSARQHKEQNRSPEHMIVPCFRVNTFHDQELAQQRQSSRARSQTEEQQDREGKLVEHRDARRNRRVEKGYLVFILKKLHGKLKEIGRAHV